MDSYPVRVREALERLRDALAEQECALVVYGSLAKGTFREDESDVNLAVVLEDADAETLFSIAAPLRVAYRAARVRPLIVESREIARIADAFPIKLADIAASHDVILGDDPFADVTIDPEHLRIGVERELRNHVLRLRRAAIFGEDDPAELAKAIFAATRSLPIELGALLDVSAKERPEGDLDALAPALAKAFDLDRATLDALVAIKAGGPIDDARGLFASVLALVERAARISDRLVRG